MNPAPWILDLGKQINGEILGRLPWIGIPTSPEDGSTDCDKKTYSFRVLDYACGEGVISRVHFSNPIQYISYHVGLRVKTQGLFNYVDEAWGIDLSSRMVNTFNHHAAALEVPKRKKMFAVQGDLLTPKDDTSFAGKEWFDFDLAMMSMALHHVSSPEDAVKMLVSRVKPGRSVLLVDFVAGSTVGGGEAAAVACNHGHGQEHGHGHGEKGHGHAHEHGHDNHAQDMPGAHTTTRDGFTKAEMEKMLTEAGCVDVGFVEAKDLTHLDFGEKRMWRRLFLAKGVKGGK